MAKEARPLDLIQTEEHVRDVKSLRAYFSDYAAYHQTYGNQVCHYIGIPLIVITLLGLLSGIVIWSPAELEGALARLDGGVILLLLGMIWYLALDVRIAFLFLPVIIAMYALGRILPASVLWAGFILGWVFQFIGHYKYEKKSPAFYKNIEHLLIGPLWVFAKLTGLRPSGA